MKLAEVIEAAKNGVSGAVACEEPFDAEHGAMDQTSAYGPGLVDLDFFRTLRNPRPHSDVLKATYAGDVTKCFPREQKLGELISQHRNIQTKDGPTKGE